MHFTDFYPEIFLKETARTASAVCWESPSIVLNVNTVTTNECTYSVSLSRLCSQMCWCRLALWTLSVEVAIPSTQLQVRLTVTKQNKTFAFITMKTVILFSADSSCALCVGVCVRPSQNGIASVWPFGSHPSLSPATVGLGTSSNSHNASEAQCWQKTVWENGK